MSRYHISGVRGFVLCYIGASTETENVIGLELQYVIGVGRNPTQIDLSNCMILVDTLPTVKTGRLVNLRSVGVDGSAVLHQPRDPE